MGIGGGSADDDAIINVDINNPNTNAPNNATTATTNNNSNNSNASLLAPRRSIASSNNPSASSHSASIFSIANNITFGSGHTINMMGGGAAGYGGVQDSTALGTGHLGHYGSEQILFRVHSSGPGGGGGGPSNNNSSSIVNLSSQLYHHEGANISSLGGLAAAAAGGGSIAAIWRPSPPDMAVPLIQGGANISTNSGQLNINNMQQDHDRQSLIQHQHQQHLLMVPRGQIGVGIQSPAGIGVNVSSSSSVPAAAAMACQDCGNKAKKDCPHMRCRTCCKSRGFSCATHLKSTWVPVSRRRERAQLMHSTALGNQDCPPGAGSELAMMGSSEPSSGPRGQQAPAYGSRGFANKRPRNTAVNLAAAAGAIVLGESSTAGGEPSHTSTSTGGTPPRSSDASALPQDHGPKSRTWNRVPPAEVRMQAVFRCVKLSGVNSDGQDEYAYQTSVKIGGHTFKGLLYDQSLDQPTQFNTLLGHHAGSGGGQYISNDQAELQLGARSSASNMNSSSTGMMDVVGIYGAGGNTLVGGKTLFQSSQDSMAIVWKKYAP